MTYTYLPQALGVIGPILFLLLLLSIPVIGVFGGWKRAAYWGGGNFIFYLIGMLIWKGFSKAIAKPFVSFVASLISQYVLSIDYLNVTVALVAPFYFLIVILVANIILVANYYIWVRSYIGIVKYEKVQHTRANGLTTVEYVKQKPKFDKKTKIINYVIGGVGLPLLTMPCIFTATQAVMMTTTSNLNRQHSGFVRGFYNFVSSASENNNWASYYASTNSFEDYDAVFSTLNMFKTYLEMTLPDGSQVVHTPALDATSQTIELGLGQIFDELNSTGDIGYVMQSAIEEFNLLANSWNQLISLQKANLQALFNSYDFSYNIRDVLGITKIHPVTINRDNINYFIGEESNLNTFINAFQEGSYEERQFDEIERLDVKEDCLNNIRSNYCDSFQFDRITAKKLDEQEIIQCKEALSKMVNLIFK